MRRSRPLRLLGLLFGAWFALNGATASMRNCPMHGAARGVASAASHAAEHTAAHASHQASAGHPTPAEHDQMPAPCDCATQCCGAVPLRLVPPPTVDLTATVLLATAAPPPPRPLAAAACARLLPFANGPPASLHG
jgi:hypothetical protein